MLPPGAGAKENKKSTKRSEAKVGSLKKKHPRSEWQVRRRRKDKDERGEGRKRTKHQQMVTFCVFFFVWRGKSKSKTCTNAPTEGIGGHSGGQGLQKLQGPPHCSFSDIIKAMGDLYQIGMASEMRWDNEQGSCSTWDYGSRTWTASCIRSSMYVCTYEAEDQSTSQPVNQSTRQTKRQLRPCQLVPNTAGAMRPVLMPCNANNSHQQHKVTMASTTRGSTTLTHGLGPGASELAGLGVLAFWRFGFLGSVLRTSFMVYVCISSWSGARAPAQAPSHLHHLHLLHLASPCGVAIMNGFGHGSESWLASDGALDPTGLNSYTAKALAWPPCLASYEP